MCRCIRGFCVFNILDIVKMHFKYAEHMHPKAKVLQLTIYLLLFKSILGYLCVFYFGLGVPVLCSP
jgi:hypothetical protein